MNELQIPKLGNIEKAEILEVLIKSGQEVSKDEAVLVVEGEKSTFDIPASAAGKIDKVLVKVKDIIKTGLTFATLITENKKGSCEQKISLNDVKNSSNRLNNAFNKSLAVSGDKSKTNIKENEANHKSLKNQNLSNKENNISDLEKNNFSKKSPSFDDGGNNFNEDLSAFSENKNELRDNFYTLDENKNSFDKDLNIVDKEEKVQDVQSHLNKNQINEVYASPKVRRVAHKEKIDLKDVQNAKPGQRITLHDLKEYLEKQNNTSPNKFKNETLKMKSLDNLMPHIVQEQTPINQSNANALSKNWQSIPHVTIFDEVDISKIDNLRKEYNLKFKTKITILSFVIKALAETLKIYPAVNSQLLENKLLLIQKYNMGVAVDTPLGLVVPVIKDVDIKSIDEIANHINLISKKARDGDFSELSQTGSTFSVSSLGNLGGLNFTPIINAPNVAILGLSKALIKPIYEHGAFIPKYVLPLSFSFDHRVIDGALAMRFINTLKSNLTKIII